MKYRRIITLTIVPVLVLIGLVVNYMNQRNHSTVFSRSIGEDCYELSCDPLNTTLEATYSLHSGDRIDVHFQHKKGNFTITIGIEGEEPIYEGNGDIPGTFTVSVPADGDYQFLVTGRNAVGDLKFDIQ